MSLWSGERHQELPTGNYWQLDLNMFLFQPQSCHHLLPCSSGPMDLDHLLFTMSKTTNSSKHSLQVAELTQIYIAKYSSFFRTLVCLTMRWEIPSWWFHKYTWCVIYQHWLNLNKSICFPKKPLSSVMSKPGLGDIINHHRNCSEAPGNYWLKQSGASYWMEEEKYSLQIRAWEKKEWKFRTG